MSQHYYPKSACGGTTNTLASLLEATSGPSVAFSAYVPDAAADRIPFRLGEFNSVACGGESGVSDVFGSALWVLDTMFAAAAAGIEGVNVHTGTSGAYAVFHMTKTTTGGQDAWTLQSVQPIYYGMLFFQQATANAAAIVSTSVATTGMLDAWATVDANSTVRVILINRDPNASGSVDVSLPAHAAGAVTRMLASSLMAASGLTIGGQTFDGSVDGRILGMPECESVTPSQGHYRFALTGASAAMLTVP